MAESGNSRSAGRSARTGRGLGDVLHHFISEEEQAEARERGRASGPAPGGCFGFVVHPRRPIQLCVASEFANVLSSGTPARVPITFEPPTLLPRVDGVSWDRVPDQLAPDELASWLKERLAPQGGESVRLLVLRPEDLSAELQKLAGWVLPVDASAHGISWALALLRKLPSRQTGALFLGPEAAAQGLYRRLAGAARRQLGIELEYLGALEPRLERALLSGRIARVEPEEALLLRNAGLRLSRLPASDG